MTKDIQRIYQEISKDIITLRLTPGEKLGEVDFARKYEVSRTPIRDVFKCLEYDRLLVIRSQSGSFVTQIDLTDIEDQMYIRSSLEYHVLMELMGKLSDKDFELLDNYLIQMKTLCDTEPEKQDIPFATALFDLDNSFHSLIYAKAGHKTVIQSLNRESPVFQRYRFLTFLRDDRELLQFYQTHEAIVRVLRDQDLMSLDRVVHAHNYSGAIGLDKVIAKHPDYFVERGGK